MASLTQSPSLSRPVARSNSAGPLLGALFIAGLIPRVWVLFVSDPRVAQFVADDAGYYLRMAAETAASGTPSVDGVNPTNGFHPLWMLILTPVAAVVESPTLLLRISMLLGVVCAMATFVVLSKTLSHRASALATALGLALWWLNPYAIETDVSGVESALVGLVFASTLATAIRYTEEPSRPLALQFGVLAGIAFLARTDAIVAVVAIGVWALVVARMGARDRSRERWPEVAVSAAAAAAVISPWLLWNALNFSTLQQASGWAVPRVHWHNALAEDGESVVSTSLSATWTFFTGEGPSFVGMPAVAMVLLLGVAGLVARADIGGRDRRQLLALGATVVSAGALLAVLHAGGRLYPRPYYFGWVNIAWAVLAVATLGCVSRAPQLIAARSRLRAGHRRLTVAVCATAFLAVGVLVTVHTNRNPPYPWQSNMVQASEWLNEQPGSSPATAFNSGLLSVYADRPVLNLDGVANNAANQAVEAKSVAAYVCANGVGWYLDFHPIFLDTYRDFLGTSRADWNLEPVRRYTRPPEWGIAEDEYTVFRSSCD